MSILNLIKRLLNQNTTNFKNLDTIVYDDIKIQRNMTNGQSESIRWDEIKEIRIITTDQGPLIDDVFWVMIGDNTGCVAPSESIGMNELISEFQKLPGFDNEEVIKAMVCTEKATFICWMKMNRQ